jgi:hypothetical protein
LDWRIVEVHVEVLRDQVVSLLGVGALFVPADKGHLVACPMGQYDFPLHGVALYFSTDSIGQIASLFRWRPLD